MTAYAELQITSNFSFLRGGSHPEELVLRAHELGLAALALTDRNTLAGVVRAHVAAKEVGIRLVVGARLDLDRRARCSAFRPTAPPTAGLSQLISQGQRRTEKGELQARARRSARARLGPDRGRPGAPETRRWLHGFPRRSPSQPAGLLPRRAASLSGRRRGAYRGPGRARRAPAARPWSRPATCSTTPPSAAPCRTC